MPQKSLISRMLLQMLGVGGYFALVAILYWRWLTDIGAVAIIVGLLFLFKAVVDSGTISIAHWSPEDPAFNIRSPIVELLKSLSFFAVGMGVWIDIVKAMQIGLMPANLPSAVIHMMLVCIFAICVVSCLARFAAALNSRSGR